MGQLQGKGNVKRISGQTMRIWKFDKEQTAKLAQKYGVNSEDVKLSLENNGNGFVTHIPSVTDVTNVTDVQEAF